MLCLRRTAFRILSSTPSKSFLTKPRSISTLTPSTLRIKQQPSVFAFQRRWATDEAEAKKEGEEGTTIIAEEATPAQEAEAAAEAEPAELAQEGETGRSAVAESEAPASEDAERSSISQSVARVAETVKEHAGSALSGVSRPFGRNLQEVTPKPSVYIGNLFFDVTAEDLKNEFSRFGTVTQCRLINDARGLSKGFGYVTFDSVDAASRAIEGMNQTVYEGRRLTVQYAAQTASKRNQPEARNPPSKTLFIGNMSFEMTDRDLNNLFKDIRNVIDVRVAIDRRTGQPRGFAHADFIDVKSAMDAKETLQDKENYGRRLRVDFSTGSSGAPRRSAEREE